MERRGVEVRIPFTEGCRKSMARPVFDSPLAESGMPHPLGMAISGMKP